MTRCETCGGRPHAPKMVGRADCTDPIHDGYHLTDEEAN